MLVKSEKIGGLSIWTNASGDGKIKVTVYCDYRPIVSFNPAKINERRFAAIQLVDLGYCKNRVAGKICGFHRNTVSKLVRTKKLLGLEAIFDDKRGPKSPWKYIGKIRQTIKDILREYPDWTDQQVAVESAKRLAISISRSAVARVRTGGEICQRPSKKDLEQLAKIADSIDVKQHDDRQLTFNFEQDPQFRKQVDDFAKESIPQGETSTDKEFLSSVEQGQRNMFAGMFFHHVFLNQVDLPGAFNFVNPGNNNIYDPHEIIEAIFFGLNLGLPSIESHKLINSRDIGLLLGRSRSPDESTIRSRLKQMSEFNLSENLIDHFADLFLKLGFINPEVFFIDGHFLPYYGLSVLSKGYHTVRRIAMKGNEIYVVTDIDGKPLFSITETCEIDFRPIILRSAEKLIALGIERPVLVFDRGGYGVHFFNQLSLQADFITWGKYVKKEELDDVEYTSCLMFNGKKYLIGEKRKTIRESISTALKEGRTEAESMDIRMVVLKEIKSDRAMPIYTSNRTKPAWDIVTYMLSRWGESENFFKEIMSLFNFNYHPGYDIKELEEQPLINNPDVKTIKNTIKGIEQKIGRLVIEKYETEVKYQTRKDVRLERKLEKIQNEIEEYRKELENFHAALKKLPDKVSILDVLKGKPMSRSDLEKKKLFDLIQMIAFHSREYLVDIFRSCYEDSRDVKQVLTMITKLPGYVKLVGKTFVVLLDWIEDKKHREAAIRFCNVINTMSPKLKGRMEFNLFFRISTISQQHAQRKKRCTI